MYYRRKQTTFSSLRKLSPMTACTLNNYSKKHPIKASCMLQTKTCSYLLHKTQNSRITQALIFSLKPLCVRFLTSAVLFIFCFSRCGTHTWMIFPPPPQVLFPNYYKCLFIIINEWSSNLHTTSLSLYFHTGTKVCISSLTLGNMFLCCSEKTYLFNMKASLGFLPQ